VFIDRFLPLNGLFVRNDENAIEVNRPNTDSRSSYL